MPTLMPVNAANSMAAPASRSVAGKRCEQVSQDRPAGDVAGAEIALENATDVVPELLGRADRPGAARPAAGRASPASARSPTMACTGSPGATYSSRKVTSSTPSRVGTSKREPLTA